MVGHWAQGMVAMKVVLMAENLAERLVAKRDGSMALQWAC